MYAIKHVCSDVVDVTKPDVCGTVAQVYLAHTPQKTLVCRFNERDIIARNHVVSNLMALADIPVPFTHTHAYMNSWFETYDYCVGQTLFDYIQSGASESDVLDVYQNVFRIQHDISQISPNDFVPRSGKTVSDVFVITNRQKWRPGVAHALGWIYSMFAQTGKQRLLHTDLQPKNILINSKTGVKKLIDLDAVSVCNEDFAVFKMLVAYPFNNREQIMECYEDTMGRKLNRTVLNVGVDLFHKLKVQGILNHKLLAR